MTTKVSVQARRVRDVMSKEVVYVDYNDDVHEALDLMIENRVNAMPVVNGKMRCVGMISTSDMVGIARDVNEDLLHLDALNSLEDAWLIEKLRQEFGETPLKSLMTPNVETIGPEATVNEASQHMLRNDVHRLPVVDENGRLLGIISTMDLLRILAHER